MGWTDTMLKAVAFGLIALYTVLMLEPWDWIPRRERRQRTQKPILKGAVKTLPTNVERHSAVCAELNGVYERKNHDYGDSFADTYKKLGIISAVTRINDKNNRLTALCMGKEAKVKDESIRDTLADMANYCIMTIMELDAETGCPLGKEHIDAECVRCADGKESDQYIICGRGVRESD